MKMLSLALAAFAAATVASNAQVRVTEYSHKGLFGEYFEVAYLGATGTTQDLTGWKFNDNSGTASTGIALPAVILNPNQTVIVTEISAGLFEQAWYGERGVSAPASLVDYVENNQRNLGKTDEIRIFNAGGTQVDTVSITSALDTEDAPAVLNAARTSFVFASTVAGQFKAGAPAGNGPTGSPGIVAP
ncbi:lamin tail domain-containing protein [Luteolibacter yonseiensis]|uniref:Lamin tail domain-containing protein n=1 Tax=Luteolibacter yonseiensis TaxID=1144680 RepID=A0A934R4D6_9BACT|nr:lamin tail domain-containing protein [Luteolibacter yonseiensis]MBK1816197.1 lamin tail domain-containing protein [Luteolibacter yonseiensis]